MNAAVLRIAAPAAARCRRPTSTTVLAIERAAYEFPWTRGNFIDSLHAGYHAQLLVDERDRLIGYFVAMAGVDEMHLLNLSVAPERQRRGHAREMLDALLAHCRAERRRDAVARGADQQRACARAVSAPWLRRDRRASQLLPGAAGKRAKMLS